MQQFQGLAEHKNEHIERETAVFAGVAINNPRFDELDIPIAKLVPEKVVESMRGFVKTKRLERVICLARQVIETGKNPTIDETKLALSSNELLLTSTATMPAFQIEQHKSSSIPDLVGESS